MTSIEITERMNKASERIVKKQATIAKKTALVEKKDDEYEKRWLLDDIKRLNSEIADLHKTIERYQKQLDGVLAKERAFAKEIPEQMIELQKSVEAEWNDYDIKRKKMLCEKYGEMSHRDFIKAYSYSGYELAFRTTIDDIKKANKRESEAIVLNLYNRVKEITGEVESWDYIHCEMGNRFPVLTGIVIGKSGRASVETVLAGGYNIQRLHIRTLVHER